MNSIYIIGALKNWNIPKLTNEITELGFDAFSEWLTPGPDADSFLLEYAKQRGWSYEQALQSHAAKHVFEFDKKHLDRCDIALAVAPFGKSAMLELGYTIGKGKPGYILFEEEPERFDVMLQFATGIFFDKQKLFDRLRKDLAIDRTSIFAPPELYQPKGSNGFQWDSISVVDRDWVVKRSADKSDYLPRCPYKWQSDKRRCKREAGHKGQHKSGFIWWTDDGDYGLRAE